MEGRSARPPGSRRSPRTAPMCPAAVHGASWPRQLPAEATFEIDGRQQRQGAGMRAVGEADRERGIADDHAVEDERRRSQPLEPHGSADRADSRTRPLRSPARRPRREIVHRPYLIDERPRTWPSPDATRNGDHDHQQHRSSAVGFASRSGTRAGRVPNPWTASSSWSPRPFRREACYLARPVVPAPPTSSRVDAAVEERDRLRPGELVDGQPLPIQGGEGRTRPMRDLQLWSATPAVRRSAVVRP